MTAVPIVILHCDLSEHAGYKRCVEAFTGHGRIESVRRRAEQQEWLSLGHRDWCPTHRAQGEKLARKSAEDEALFAGIFGKRRAE